MIRARSALLGAVGVYGLVGFYAVRGIRRGEAGKAVANAVTGCLVLCTLLMALSSALGHLQKWAQPGLQVAAIRILLMCPIYGMESFLAFSAASGALATVWETLRESYEALVIYCFVRFLIMELALTSQSDPAEKGGQTHDADALAIKIMLAKGRHVRHTFGMQCCLAPWLQGEEFLVKVKMGTMQYVYMRLLCTVAALIMQALHCYDEGNLGNPYGGYLWCTILLTLSQTWALYVLWLFYSNLHEELASAQPHLKFLAVKGVIFLPFWQDVLLAALDALGALPPPNGPEVFTCRQIQDLLVCVEMFGWAVCMHLAFPACYGTSHGGGSIAKVAAEAAWQVSSPQDIIKESEETAALLTGQVEVSGAVQLGLSTQFDGEDQLVELGVRVIAARNLAAGDMGNLSDPYGRVSLLDTTQQVLQGSQRTTSVVNKTLNPQWNPKVDEFWYSSSDLPMLPSADVLLIEVLDSDYGGLKSTWLGKVELSLGALEGMRCCRGQEESEMVAWYTLCP